MSTTRRVATVAGRWLVLALGVGLTTLSFVELVEVDNQIARAAPWWWLGLIGMATTLLALGAPWSARRRRDDAS